MKVTFTLPSGKTYDAFVGDKIADGRSGTLHEARRLSGEPTLPEQMVVKRASGSSGRLLDIEREIYSKLEHPSLARFLGWGHSPSGAVLAFERLAENPLTTFNAPGRRPSYRDPGTAFYPLPLGRALELGMDVLLALEYLHSRGFVHGAIKPSTLFARVTGPADERAEVLTNVAEGAFEGIVGGLGAARSIEFLEKLAQGEGDPSLAPSLDPIYSPPEALAAAGAPVRGPSMDIYGFALLFYTFLTGHNPYDHVLEHLTDVEQVLELKTREARGELSPCSVEAIDSIPLHDVALEGLPAKVWIEFRTALVHLFRLATWPDPSKRMTATQVREFFERELGLRPSLASGPRPWTARLVQMRPRCNRLVGDEPSGGLSIREEDGAFVVEEHRPRKRPVTPPTAQGVAEGSIVAFRPQDRAAKTTVGTGRKGLFPEAPKGMVYLGEVLREHQARRPLPVTAPVLITRTTFSPKDLANSMMFSLGRASTRMRVEASGRSIETVRVVIGRGDGADIVIPDTSVSKKHVAIERRDGYWWVEDLGSTNGTVVDGHKVTKGSRLRIRGRFATIQIGPDSRVTFMEEQELLVFLDNALDAWSQAFGKGAPQAPVSKMTPSPPRAAVTMVAEPASAADEGFADIAPQAAESPAQESDHGLAFADEAPQAPPQPEAPTRLFRRDNITRKIAQTLSKAGPGPAEEQNVPSEIPPDLEERLAWHDKARAAFRFILRGSRVEEPESVEEALETLRDAGEDLLSIEVIPREGGKIVLFRRPSPDDSQELPIFKD